MNDTIQVAGFLGSRNGVTLFLADGTSRVFTEENWQTKSILDEIIPALAKGESIQIDLTPFSVKKAFKSDDEKVRVETRNGQDMIVVGDNQVAVSDIHDHVHRAIYGEGMKGFTKFMVAYDSVAQVRKHSADDLLAFMKAGDLVIADDGSVLALKVLAPADAEGYCLDKHSRTVKQRLGSLVTMPEALVDANRSASCSKGLHVCSVKYVGGFAYGNDAIFVVKVRPEDFIAVPHGEVTKVRCCAYHNVARVPDHLIQGLRSGKALFETPDGEAFLSKVMAGDHAHIVEIITVKGVGDVTVLVSEKAPEKKAIATKTRRLAVGKSKPIDLKAIKASAAKAIASRPKRALTPAEIRDRAYQDKLKKAIRLVDKGSSIREVAKLLGIGRDNLSAALKAR